jgi:hypothetical protein
MTYIEFDAWLIDQAKRMPRAMNDRALQQQEKQTFGATTGVANQAGANASGLYGPLQSFGTNMMTAPPGYGADLQNMQAIAGEEASSASNNAAQSAALAAARGGNAAGINASQDAAAQQASAAGGANQQDILAQNAQLKQQQQQEGAGLLSGLYGTNVNAQLSALGQQPEDIKSGVNAQQVGWLQNVTGVLGALGSLGTGVGAAATGICWVAAELYGGWNTLETFLIRRWLVKTWYMQPFVFLYQRFGRQWSEFIVLHRSARDWTKILFDVFLRKARG